MSRDYDSGDLDNLLELEHTPGYALVWQAIEREIARRLTHLEADLDANKTAHTRGYIEALRMVLTIPRGLQDEIKSQLDKEIL